MLIAGEELTDADVSALSGCKNLRAIDLTGCPRLTARCLAGLIDLPSLAVLPAAFPLDDQALAELARFPSLQELPQLWLSNVSDAGLAHVGRMTSLSEVSIDSPLVTDRGIAALSGCANLRKLTLRGVPLTDESLKSIAAIPRLEYLVLIGVPVTDAGLPHLKGLTYFNVLRLVGTKVTPDAFRRFAAEKFPNHRVRTDGDLELDR